MTKRVVGRPFDEQERLAWATAALEDARASAEPPGGNAPPDLVPPDGWRWRVLRDLTALSGDLKRDYETAQAKQARQAWETRFGGPAATGGGAAFGAVISAAGAGLISTNTIAGWVILLVGIIFAVAASIFSANSYVQNRNMKLRYLRTLHDLWDYAYMVLPTAGAPDAFDELGKIRDQWETAGS